MRTGNDVFRRAISLLGYTGADGAVNGAQSAELFRRGFKYRQSGNGRYLAVGA